MLSPRDICDGKGNTAAFFTCRPPMLQCSGSQIRFFPSAQDLGPKRWHTRRSKVGYMGSSETVEVRYPLQKMWSCQALATLEMKGEMSPQ